MLVAAWLAWLGFGSGLPLVGWFWFVWFVVIVGGCWCLRCLVLFALFVCGGSAAAV